GERADGGVVEDTGEVDDGPHIVPVEQLAGRAEVGEIAGGQGHLGAEVRQFGAQRVGAGGRRAAPADQQQPAHTVTGDQVPGDETAEGAGGAGDEGGAGRVEANRFALCGAGQVGLGAHQPGRVQRAVPYDDLGLLGGEHGREVRLRVAVEVGEHDP